MRISDWSSDVCSSDLCLELNLGRCDAVWIAVVRTSDVRTATNLHPQSRCQAVTCCFIPAEARRSGFGLLGAVVFVSWLSSCLLSFHEEAAGDLRRGWLRCWHLLEIGRAPSELQSLMRISYAVFCLKKKKKKINMI